MGLNEMMNVDEISQVPTKKKLKIGHYLDRVSFRFWRCKVFISKPQPFFHFHINLLSGSGSPSAKNVIKIWFEGRRSEEENSQRKNRWSFKQCVRVLESPIQILCRKEVGRTGLSPETIAGNPPVAAALL